jgi:ABC-type phosphate/phosphonate transport system substrate-binding protein
MNIARDNKRNCHAWQKPARAIIICALLLMAITRIAISPVRLAAQSLTFSDLNVGFSEISFYGVNRNDAEAAFKAYLVNISRQRGYEITARTQVFKSARDFEAAIHEGKLHLSIIPSWDYLTMDIQKSADPYFVAAGNDGIMQTYILLTQRNSGIKSFADLRGKNILVLESMSAFLSAKWMETVLLQEKLGKPENFFGRVEKVAKISNAILPVFFGKQQACVVDLEGFEVMKELNPQLGERLQPVAFSEPLLSAVICLSKSGWINTKHKEDLKSGLVNLKTRPAGQQIMTLFRIKEMESFKPEYLETVKKLKSAHDRMLPQAAQIRQDR